MTLQLRPGAPGDADPDAFLVVAGDGGALTGRALATQVHPERPRAAEGAS